MPRAALCSCFSGLAKAAVQMIVDYSHRLHEGVADGRADELEAALEEILAKGVGLGGLRRHLAGAAPAVDDRFAADEAPDVRIEAAELALHGEKRLGVADGRVDLQPVAHDAVVLHQLSQRRGREVRYLRRVEASEGAAIGVALAQDRLPAEARLG